MTWWDMELNNVQYRSRETYRMAKARDDAKRERAKFGVAAHAYDQLERQTRAMKEEEARAEAHQNRLVESERRREIVESAEKSKTEREQLRLERAKLEAEARQQELAERRESVEKLQGLEKAAEQFTRECRAAADRYAHPARIEYMGLGRSLRVGPAVESVLGPSPADPGDPPPLPPLSSARLAFMQERMNPLGYYCPPHDEFMGRRRIPPGSFRPMDIDEAVTAVSTGSIRERLAGKAALQERAQAYQESVNEQRTVLWQQDLERSYQAELERCAEGPVREAGLHAKVIMHSVSSMKAKVGSIESRAEDVLATRVRIVSQHAKDKAAIARRAEEIASLSSMFEEALADYANGFAPTVESFVEACAGYSLRDYAPDSVELVGRWDAETGEAVIDFALPKLWPPAVKEVVVSQAAEMTVDRKFDDAERRGMEMAVERELPLRVAVEVLNRDYAGKITRLTVNAWRRGLPIDGVMRGVVCCESLTTVPAEVRAYDGNAEGFMRAVGARYDSTGDSPVIPAATSVVAGTLDHGDLLERAGVFLPLLFANNPLVGIVADVVEQVSESAIPKPSSRASNPFEPVPAAPRPFKTDREAERLKLEADLSDLEKAVRESGPDLAGLRGFDERLEALASRVELDGSSDGRRRVNALARRLGASRSG